MENSEEKLREESLWWIWHRTMDFDESLGSGNSELLSGSGITRYSGAQEAIRWFALGSLV